MKPIVNAPALACFAAAVAWPSMVAWTSNALASPLERALRDAWCGAPLHASTDVLGHCAACWSGSALLVLMGVWLLRQRAPAKARS